VEVIHISRGGIVMGFDYKQWHRQNKAGQNKSSRDRYYRLKQQVYQDYGFSCEMNMCNECNIKELELITTYNTPEAETLRKVKAGDKRLRYLRKVGYSEEFGIVVVCKNCRKVISHAISSENKKVKSVKVRSKRKSPKVGKKRSLRDRLKGLFRRSPERKRSKRKKKDKKRLEKWLKAKALSLTNKIAIDRNKLAGYEKRLEKLEKNG
jgi:hypothetical protein